MGNYNESYKNYYKSLNSGGREHPTSNYSTGGSGGVSYRKSNYRNRSFNRYRRTNYLETFMKQSIFVILLIVIFGLTPYMGAEKGMEVRNNFSFIIKKWDMSKDLKGIGLKGLQESAIKTIDKCISKISKKESVFVTIEDEFIFPVDGKISFADSDEMGVCIKNNAVGVVKSAYAGEVTKIEYRDKKYYVTINHGKGVETKYEGLSNFYWAEGDTVDSGEKIGFCQVDKEDGFRMTFRLYYMGEEKDVLDYMDVDVI